MRDQAPNIVAYDTSGGTILMGCSLFRCIDRFDPTPWFVAGSALILTAALPSAAAVRSR